MEAVVVGDEVGALGAGELAEGLVEGLLGQRGIEAGEGVAETPG
jgi:hypothetical protein